jgi:DNA-binding transcriptional regulator LsrR (DeoR family)
MILELFKHMNSISQHDLTKICYLYYKEGQTQEEISSVFGLSRFKISRLLKKARGTGLVSIQINLPADDLTEIEVKLAKKFHLKQSIVVKVNEFDDKTPALQIGEAGALYLSNIIHRCNILGVAWGRSLSYVVHNIRPVEVKGLIVVQITGGMGAIEGTDAIALTMAFAQKLSAKAYIIQAPVIVRDRANRDAFLKEKQVREASEIARKADVAIFGIGLPSEDGLLSRAGFLTKKNSAALEKAGAVGAICGRFFDIDGLPCRNELDDRIIGLNLDEFRKIQHKVAIAFTPRKVKAILAAMRGRYLDVLITDEKTALDLLNRS